MLSNRFKRFLTTILMGVGLLLVALWIEEHNDAWGWTSSSATVILTVLVTFAVCIVGQFFGDIMNVDGWFNNAFFMVLKRLIFFVVVLAGLFVGMSVLFDGTLAEIVEAGSSVFEFGFCAAVAYSPAIALLCYVLEYASFSSKKERMPFYFPISYFAGLALGVLTGWIVTLANLQEVARIIILVVELLMLVVSCVICFKQDWPFNEDGFLYNSSSTPSYNQPRYSRDDDEDASPEGCCKYCKYLGSYQKDTNDYGAWTECYYCQYHNTNLDWDELEIKGCKNYKDRW